MVEYGVPQVSVLGPLLFSINLNDKKFKTFFKLYMFADDISVFYPFKRDTSLKIHMECGAAMIIKYTRLNRLCLNAEKTKVMRLCLIWLMNKILVFLWMVNFCMKFTQRNIWVCICKATYHGIYICKIFKIENCFSYWLDLMLKPNY